ncbi:helix-turn-helix transcriptional regulator [Brevibacillus nitrificans]|uniref:helix-turn-helix domain-containing protein n=1 Tax=Brevibacillus nitrificans TaxID=651560 RepID=UPI002857870D|nr:helix-turn-helix transcriptional regulator [Brevibacillus nitrificans]MDR7318951.1 transcriptional regulator with XRE-family HTH domain [Brevibacillus nitrificans]
MLKRKKIFSERLGLLLDLHDTMAKDLAKSIGLHKSSVSLYLTEKSFPTVEKLLDIADYFDVSIDYLVGRTAKKNAHK